METLKKEVQTRVYFGVNPFIDGVMHLPQENRVSGCVSDVSISERGSWFRGTHS